MELAKGQKIRNSEVILKKTTQSKSEVKTKADSKKSSSECKKTDSCGGARPKTTDKKMKKKTESVQISKQKKTDKNDSKQSKEKGTLKDAESGELAVTEKSEKRMLHYEDFVKHLKKVTLSDCESIIVNFTIKSTNNVSAL